MTPLEVLSLVLCIAGAGFFVAGTAGLLRFPDVYTRLHALTKADNLGLGLMALGLILRAESPAAMLKHGSTAAKSGGMAGRTEQASGGQCRPPPGYPPVEAGVSMLGLVLDAVLGLGLVLVAWRALACAELFRAVVLFVVFSLLLAVAWVRLSAPDIAHAEAAIGAGLTGALLLAALAELQGPGGGAGAGNDEP